ncbi:MAG TPA: hypothetical protein VNH18_11065 [Bryobacteraceae bacterium]|nr:hypothetical protein [Bryobacteraceae bacterium]
MHWDRRVEGQDMDVPLDVTLKQNEIKENFEERVQALIETGMSQEEATSTAREEFERVYANRKPECVPSAGTDDD